MEKQAGSLKQLKSDISVECYGKYESHIYVNVTRRTHHINNIH